MPSVSLENVSKRYKVFPNRQAQLKEILSFGRIKRGHDFWALRDVSLEIGAGQSVGIIGRNGAGKSTLLQAISGVLRPTRGSVRVEGRLVALLQLGAGFNPEFTGRENAILNGLILGIDRKDMAKRFDDIEEFADIGQFMDQPLKTYSSGMRARLGFAVAVNVEPEILLVDEVLAVGDAAFRQLSLQRMRELQESGTTTLFVSHSAGMVKSFCEKAVLLHKGQVVSQGDTSRTLDDYQALLSGTQARNVDLGLDSAPDQNASRNGDAGTPEFARDPDLAERRGKSLRRGSGEVEIQNVELLNEFKHPTDVVAPGSTLTIRVHLKYLEEIQGSNLGITLRNRTGLDIYATSANEEDSPIRRRLKGERVIIDFSFKASVAPGQYSVNVSAFQPPKMNVYDWIETAASFEVTLPSGRANIRGLVHLPTEVRIHEPNAAP